MSGVRGDVGGTRGCRGYEGIRAVYISSIAEYSCSFFFLCTQTIAWRFIFVEVST